MPIYDCTFILSSQLDEAGLESRVKSARDLIERSGGRIVNDNRIGLRRLAYEINNMTQGYYVNLVFDASGDIIPELERQFRLDESVLRFLTCQYEEFGRREERPSRHVESEMDYPHRIEKAAKPSPEDAEAELEAADEDVEDYEDER